ncbi:golgin subfamily A member 6-like protein 6 [Lates japonicus]|uniref:Golgin subfamily A member 6-like protein 6 n=1 Tax=Lates japonicus TaxID=270547 RepID=A0AAD3NFX0_LATJO|nr:golgin subfamily A member 6-like protein 6 [Lates japonicus]
MGFWGKEGLILENHRELSLLRETLKHHTEELHFSSTQLCLKNKQLNEAITRCSSLEEKLREQFVEREKEEMKLSSLQESLITQKEETNLWVNKYEEVKTALEEETQRSADLQCQGQLTLENELNQSISRFNALEEQHNKELLRQSSRVRLPLERASSPRERRQTSG